MVTALLVLLALVAVWCLVVLIQIRNELWAMRRETKGWLDGIELAVSHVKGQLIGTNRALEEIKKRIER